MLPEDSNKRKDNFIIRLTKNGLSESKDCFQYDYLVRDEKRVIYDSTANIDQDVIIDSVTNCEVINLKFNLMHTKDIKKPMYFELYSEIQKSKQKWLVEFCEILPNSTNYYLIILYTVFIFSLLFSTLIPLHFLFFQRCLKKEDSGNFYSNFVNLFWLTILFIVLFSSTYFIYITAYEIGWKLILILSIIISWISLVVYFQYKYYYSKFLFAQHRSIYDQLIGKSTFLVRKNKYYGNQVIDDENIKRSKIMIYK